MLIARTLPNLVMLRLVLTSLLLLTSLSGCLTAAAFHDLRTANDLLDVGLKNVAYESPKPNGPTEYLAWKAEYGRKPDSPDDVITPYLHRKTEINGVLCWPRVDGKMCDSVVVASGTTSAAGFKSVITRAALESDETQGSTGRRSSKSIPRCSVQLSRFVEGQGIASLVVDTPRQADGARSILGVIPGDKPSQDLARWGWLIASPFLDVASVVVLPPVLLVREIAITFGEGGRKRQPAAENGPN